MSPDPATTAPIQGLGRCSPVSGLTATRFAPVQGIRQFVVGTGGRNLTAFRKSVDAGSQIRLQKFGILDLELAPRSYTWRFRAVPNGAVLDGGTTACR